MSSPVAGPPEPAPRRPAPGPVGRPYPTVALARFTVLATCARTTA